MPVRLRRARCIVAASAHALCVVFRLLIGIFCTKHLSVGDEVSFEKRRRFVGMGYVDTGEVDVPGSFHVHGDTVDVFPAQSTSAVRLEFFGDD